MKLPLLDFWGNVIEIGKAEGREEFGIDDEFNFWLVEFDVSDIQLVMYRSWHDINASRI